jgi:hypothetical protein
MARNRSATFAKRERERTRLQRRNEKAERKAQRKAEKENTNDTDVAPGEDPDIAGIVPGPQPPPEEAKD